MNVLVITQDNTTPLIPKYVVNGPMTIDEAVELTKEAALVIILTDSATAKANQRQVDRLHQCVANSPLACRKEKQVKTMEYVVGSLLSELVNINSFPEPVRITHKSYAETEIKRALPKMPEALALSLIGDLGDSFYRTHKKNVQLVEYV